MREFMTQRNQAVYRPQAVTLLSRKNTVFAAVGSYCLYSREPTDSPEVNAPSNTSSTASVVYTFLW